MEAFDVKVKVESNFKIHETEIIISCVSKKKGHINILFRFLIFYLPSKTWIIKKISLYKQLGSLYNHKLTHTELSRYTCKMITPFNFLKGIITFLTTPRPSLVGWLNLHRRYKITSNVLNHIIPKWTDTSPVVYV